MIAGIRDWVKLDSKNYGRFAWSNPDVMESGFQSGIHAQEAAKITRPLMPSAAQIRHASAYESTGTKHRFASFDFWILRNRFSPIYTLRYLHPVLF